MRISCRTGVSSALLVCAVCCSPALFAQSGIPATGIERAGQSGWQFLKINGDARQAAMAGAFTAIGKGDAGAIFGNPASLSDVRGFDVAANVVQWVADIGYQSVAVAAHLGDFGVVGVSVATLDYGDIEETVNIATGPNTTQATVTGNTVHGTRHRGGGIVCAEASRTISPSAGPCGGCARPSPSSP